VRNGEHRRTGGEQADAHTSTSVPSLAIGGVWAGWACRVHTPGYPSSCCDAVPLTLSCLVAAITRPLPMLATAAVSPRSTARNVVAFTCEPVCELSLGLVRKGQRQNTARTFVPGTIPDSSTQLRHLCYAQQSP
jgi:hypothetical protein